LTSGHKIMVIIRIGQTNFNAIVKYLEILTSTKHMLKQHYKLVKIKIIKIN